MRISDWSSDVCSSDLAHAPLDNKSVRQALNMAIDQKAIVDVVTFGYGTPANSFFPLDGMYYNPENPNYAYDPEKAKAMLGEAGVSDLSLDFVLVPGDSAHDKIGVLAIGRASCRGRGCQ